MIRHKSSVLFKQDCGCPLALYLIIIVKICFEGVGDGGNGEDDDNKEKKCTRSILIGEISEGRWKRGGGRGGRARNKCINV